MNIRGTGCSGGSFEFFEPSQLLDGYDMIEAIAAQPWVLGNQVGMVGISYPGISQLFVASTQPPSLAAIRAGNDLLIYSNHKTRQKQIGRKIFGIIKAAVEDGRISRARIAEAYNRIIALKTKLSKQASRFSSLD